MQLERFGISSRITALAYDPVQSLLAAGVGASQFGAGQIYVFGRERISKTLPLASPKSNVKTIQFCADRLLALDDRGDFTMYSLPDMRLVTSYSPPGQVTCIASDPTLDFVLLGLSNGEIMGYDLDREGIAPFRLPCLWAEFDQRAKHIPVVSLQFHPRDIGKLLIGYWEGAVIFSFKRDAIKLFLKYQVPRGAPGGNADPVQMKLDRSPRVTQALWHPTGTFVMTGHEDSSLVFWDSIEGRMLVARSLTDTRVDQPGARPAAPGPNTPLVKIAWCAKPDPDDIGILIAGGTSAAMPNNGLTFFELGRTPNFTTSSWQVLAEHLENPKRQHILPTPPAADVIDFCLIPRKSPWFAGSQDPLAVIALLSSGEITTMSFPSGFPIPPTNQINLSLTLVSPFVSTFNLSNVERSRWLGMTEYREAGPKFLEGGAEAPHPMRRFEGRAIVQTAHNDGTIKIWDAGHGDEIENTKLCQADVCRAAGRMDVRVSKMSMSGASGELVVGLQSGELIVFRWSRNSRPGMDSGPAGPNQPKQLINVSDRKDPTLIEGFHPICLLDQQQGPVTAVEGSDVGFVAAGFQGGNIVLIDLRGPVILLNAQMTDFAKKEKHTFRKRSDSAKETWVTCLAFSVMMLEDENYSSILLHAGTNTGNVATFKILPKGAGGGYGAEYVGSSSLDDSIVSISPFETVSGRAAKASQQIVGSLRNGTQVDGALLVASQSQARIYRPPTAKGASKSFDGAPCTHMAITQVETRGMAAVGVFADGTVTAYTLPGLSKIATQRLDGIFDKRKLHEVGITAGGELLGWTGPSELMMVYLWGVDRDL